MSRYVLSRILLLVILSASFVALSFLLLRATNTQAISPSPQPHTTTPVCFVSDGQTTCVDRSLPSSSATITDQVRALTQLLIAGPTPSETTAGIQSALPAHTQIGQVNANERQGVIGLILPDNFLRALTDNQVEDINAQFHTTFTPFNFQRIEIKARGSVGAYRLLSDFLPKIEIPRKEPSPPRLRQPLPSRTQRETGEGGGLSGKTVFVSAGHGWKGITTTQTYRTQRPVYPQAPYPAGEGIIEDFNNAEAVNQYLLPYLWNAGADAWTVRERDMNTAMLIVDDGGAGFTAQGEWSLNSGGYAGTYRSTTTAVGASPTATATWAFTLPITDTYAVYVRFPTVTIASTVDAHFFVDRAGAVTPVTITQARDRDNWRFIGHYPFYGGKPARIWLTNQSNTPGVTVLADAIRLGGGVNADTPAPEPTMLNPSGKPRWEEQAWTYAKWIGLTDVISYNDVIVRPIYSEWEKEAGEDAVYLAWHTNGYTGYNTVARGTESYVYLTPTLNSTLLQDAVHTQLLGEIHSGWDAGWPDRGKKQENLGELRLLESMPGVLIENGYHDNPIDVAALKDPRFLQLSARAVYHGLVNYWHAIDPNVPLTYLPEPPQRVVVRNSGLGQITIEWQPGPTDEAGPLGDAATAYRVYTSADGFGWSNPTEVATTAYTLTGLAPNRLIFVKVSGVNAGGESFTSPVLAARTPIFGAAPVLIIYGFERIDPAGDIQQNDPPEGVSRRVFVDRINRFDYIIQHADAITLPFDSALHAIVSNSAIRLDHYSIVDWIAGEEQTPFPVLTPSDQNALTTYLNNGGAVFISGAEIGNELQGKPFYANTLRAAFVISDAQTYSASPTVGGLFDGPGAINFDDGTHGTYDVDRPDGFNPANGAASALVYNTGAPAAVQYAAGACTRLVYMGLPFETIYPAATRRVVMDRVMGFLGTCLPQLKLSAVYLPVILNGFVPEPPTCYEALTNGDFESGRFAPAWSPLAQNPPPAIVMDTVRSGSYAARVGAATTSDPMTQTSYSSFEQVFSLPANALTATLSFARYRWSGDVISDTQYIVVIDQVGQTHYLTSEHVHDPAWVVSEFDLTPYVGQTIKLWFGVVNKGDHNGSTGMAIDDVQAQICAP